MKVKSPIFLKKVPKGPIHIHDHSLEKEKMYEPNGDQLKSEACASARENDIINGMLIMDELSKEKLGMASTTGANFVMASTTGTKFDIGQETSPV